MLRQVAQKNLPSPQASPVPLCLHRKREDCHGTGLPICSNRRTATEWSQTVLTIAPLNTLLNTPSVGPAKRRGTHGTIVRPKRLTARTGTLQTPSFHCAITTRSIVFRVRASGSTNSPAFLPRVGNLSRLDSKRRRLRIAEKRDPFAC